MHSSDDDVVRDKPTGIKIKGEAKRQEQLKISEIQNLQATIKSFLESKEKILYHQKKRQALLEQKILPHIFKEFDMIRMLDQDKTINTHKKKQYIRKLFKNKTDAVAFYKKHLT